jgi:hypothetical protein
VYSTVEPVILDGATIDTTDTGLSLLAAGPNPQPVTITRSTFVSSPTQIYSKGFPVVLENSVLRFGTVSFEGGSLDASNSFVSGFLTVQGTQAHCTRVVNIFFAEYQPNCGLPQ